MGQRESKLVRGDLNGIVGSNSDKSTLSRNKKETEKKLKPIVKKGNVVKKKKTIMERFKNSFLGDSQNIGDWVVHDILVPAFRDTISDMGFGIIERTFGGGRSRSSSRRGISRDRGRSYVSYNSNRDYRDRGLDRRDIDRSSRARHDFDTVIFTHKWEAEEVLSHLVDLVIEYGEATVRSFYELSNIEADYTDDRYGWTNLRDAYVDRTRQGYVIAFPPTRPL